MGQSPGDGACNIAFVTGTNSASLCAWSAGGVAAHAVNEQRGSEESST